MKDKKMANCKTEKGSKHNGNSLNAIYMYSNFRTFKNDINFTGKKMITL